MSSRRRSIIKFLPEARNSSAFSVEIYIKDFTREIICESLKYFLRSNPHKNPRNTRRTRILVEDYSYDFYLDFEPVRRSIIKRSYRATYCCAFWYEIFVKDSRGVTNLRPQTSDFILVKDFIFIHPEWYIISGHRPYFIKDFLQRFLAFRLPQKIPFPKTVICYLLFVTQKIHFQKLSTVKL